MDINEDSLDLYTDLISEDYSNQPSKTDSTESQQEISEVLVTAKATIESLEIELQEKAKKEADLRKRIEILEKNNSSLLLTAKSELGRKNSVISDLRDQIDEHTKSLFYNGRFNKFPDKNQIYSSRKSGSPVNDTRKRKNEEIDEKKNSKRCRTTQRSEGSVTKNDGETESKTNKLFGNRSPKNKSCDGTSDKIKICDRTKNVETFDLREKLRRRKISGKDSCQRQKVESKSSTNGEDDTISCENQSNGEISKSDTGETKLPVPVKELDNVHAKLSEKGIPKSTLMKPITKCSIMDVVNKLSNKVNDHKSKFVIPKLSKRRSSSEEFPTMDNRVLDSCMSAESSDETEKLIVDLNSASDLKRPSLNSQLNTEVNNAKCNVSQSETSNQVNDVNGNIEKVPKTFQIERKQTTSGSDSDFASKLQICVDMLSDSDPNETEVWNANQTLETSTDTNKVPKVNDIEQNNLKHDVMGKTKNSSSVKDLNETEKELMSPPKFLPKKKKCENKDLSDTVSQISANINPDISEKVASDSSSNILTDSSPNLAQTLSVVNRILDLSKSVALSSQTQNVTHRPPVENNYEEPKHNTIAYFTWKIPHQLTFSDTNQQSFKYREQTRVFGIQDVPLSDPRTKITGTEDKIPDTNIVTNTPKPTSALVPDSRVSERAAMSKELNSRVNDLDPSIVKQHKDHEEKKSSRSKDFEKRSPTSTERNDNVGLKVRLNLQKSPVKDKSALKTPRSEKASEDNNRQQNKITRKNEDKELPGTSNDVNKTSKKPSKKSSSSKSNQGEQSVKKLSNSCKTMSKQTSKTQTSAQLKDAIDKATIEHTVRHVTENNTCKEREQSYGRSSASPNKCAEIASNANTLRLENTSETDIPVSPIPKSHLPYTPISKAELHSNELDSPKSVTKPNESPREISNQFHSIEEIEIKSEPIFEPAPSTSSGLNALSGIFMANHAGSNNETEFLKRLNKIEEEIQMLKSAAMQSLQTKVIYKTEKVFTSQESESQQMLGTGTNDNPIIIPSSSDVATDISQAVVSGSDTAVSESENVVRTQSDIICDESPSYHKSSENVSKDSPLSPLSPVKPGIGVSKAHPIQGVADSSSGLGASQTSNSEIVTKASMNTTEDSNSSNNSSFSVHSADSSVSSSFEAHNVRNSFTIHETLVTCTNSDTEDSLSESSEDEHDMDIETDPHCDNEIDLNQNAAAVLKTDLNMSSDSEDGCKDHSNLLPQTVETPNDVGKNVKTPMKQNIQSPWNRISPVPKFVSPENVNCDSKLLALVNLATLDLHLSGHDVPFENKALSSKNENSNISPDILSSTPCYRKTRSKGNIIKDCLPELSNNEINDSNIVKLDNPQKKPDSNSSLLTPVISPSIGKFHAPKASSAESPVDNFPVMCSDNPASPEVVLEKAIVTDELKTCSEESPSAIQIPRDVKRSPNIEDFKIFQSVENDTVEDTTEPIREKEDGEITQDSMIVNDNHKQLSINPDSVYFVIDTKVDENDELFMCSNSVSEKPTKKLVTPKKKQLSSIKTRSSPRIRDKSLHDRLGVRDRTERRASDASNSRKRSRRSPSPKPLRSDGRRRLYDNNNIKSDNKSESKPLRKPLTDSVRDRDRDNERTRYKDEPTRRSSRDRSDRYRSRNCRSRS